MRATLTLAETVSPHLPAAVPYAVLAPEADGPLPLCMLLMGAGGTRDSLASLQPVFEQWWSDGSVPPLVVATPSGGLDYYLEDPDGSLRWDSFLAGDWLGTLRASCPVDETACIAGISGGGYGALKLAFGRPGLFRAVAAMQPMLEPGLAESEAGPRNRLHHLGGGPPRLIGPGRDPALWAANNPAHRARAHAAELHETGLAIYLEAAGRDFLNAHDGAEFLHRVLWDLDLPHEYHLVRDADHGGPTMRPRLHALFTWLGGLLHPAPLDAAAEEAAGAWLASGMQGTPPPGATATRAFVDFLRARFAEPRAEAARRDPTTNRHFGRL